jgi:general secretion pathway protein K
MNAPGPGARSSNLGNDERGVALLVTILVVTLLTIVVLEFTDTTTVEAHLTRHALSATKAHYLARAGVTLAELTLKTDGEEKAKTNRPYDALTDAWAQPVEPRDLGDGVGRAGFAIADESARFNVNALSLAAGGNPAILGARRTALQSILATSGIDTNVTSALIDWLDPDDEVTGQYGAESEFYSKEVSPPYQPRNGRMLSLDELALVKGFGDLTHEQWSSLRSALTVLPSDQLRINVNTASEAVLIGILTPIDAALAREIVTQQLERPFTNMNEVWQLPGGSQVPGEIKQMFGVQSQTFTIHGIGLAGDIARGVAVTVNRSGAAVTEVDWRDEPASLTLTSPGSGGINPLLP